MKRLLLFILAALMLFTACAGPGTGTDNSTNDGSTPDGSTSSGDTSDTSDNTSVDESTWDYHTLVSKGKPYTTTSPSSEGDYSDLFNQQLTDGEKTYNIGSHYTDSRMVGFEASFKIQIDLGEDSKNIREIVARSLVLHTDGVRVASNARFEGSVDGEKWDNLGMAFFQDTVDFAVSEARLELKEQKDYRYIRVLINKGDGAWFIFTDEVEVYANVPPATVKDMSAEAYAQENIDRDAWLALSTGVAATPTATEVVSAGSNYKIEGCDIDERAPEASGEGSKPKLTDSARTNQYFSDPVWVGISPKEDQDATITMSVGETRDDIYAIKIHALGSGVDVEYPAYIDAYASKGGSYVFIGRMYGPSSGGNFVYQLILPEYIEAKLIQFVLPKGTGNYWLEEIEVIAGHNDGYSEHYFAPLDFPNVTEDLFWDASEADYATEQNLLLGRIQQIAPLFYDTIDRVDSDGHIETAGDSPILTDGKFANDTYCYSAGWFFSRGNHGLEFIYDLDKLSSVNSVTVSMLEQEEWAILRPKFASILISEDGKNWYKVGDFARGDAELYTGATRYELVFNFDKTYAARFIRVRIENGFTFIDEIEAMGTKKVDENTVRLADSGLTSSTFYLNEESEQFATTENTPVKASQIPIVYANKSTPENLLPMVAYLDEEGNIKDTFMDGFLYCISGGLPSGNQCHLANYKQDWDYLYDTWYAGQAGFDVLEETVQTVKDTLNKPDYKVQVYITLFQLIDTITEFGDVDGDGVSENMSIAADRKKVIDWYINRCVTEFNARGYKNLEIGGFYFMNENVCWEKDDSAIITEVANYVHENGQYLLWIPYYTANRYYLGYEMGFDCVSMQPNYVFTNNAELWRFSTAIDYTKLRKMAIEIEHSYQAFGDPDFARSYLLYLYYGVVSGYDKAINIYYDDIDNIGAMGLSDSALCRMQYDYTYQYAKGTLNITPETKEKYVASGAADTIISGNLNEAAEIANFTLLTAPEHGYVAFSDDGTFRYFPDKGYTGTDTFTYTYNRLLGESEPCTVEITVG